MKNLPRWLYNRYIDLINSLAFYPSLIGLTFLVFSFVVVAVEYSQPVSELKQAMGVLLVDGVDNARLILGTIVGSIFSLMVFSFSMVMLVLNRASATLSPRVIPGLITKKSHQIVLGIYIGTIVYSLVLITNIQSVEAKFKIPSLGVFIDMIFAIGCLGLFTYFIDSISRSIQADNILDRIYRQTWHRMKELDRAEEQVQVPDTESWHRVYSHSKGYLKQINDDSLLRISTELDIIVQIQEHQGFFMLEGYPLLRCNKKLAQEEEEKLRNCFIFYIEERVSDHYLFGFKQISEIAVKALSPGINDPGTAVKALDLLTILFIEKMRIRECVVKKDEQGQARVYYTIPSLDELLFNNLTPIREYGKGDATVMYKLLECLKNLVFTDQEERSYSDTLSTYTSSVVASCDAHIENKLDRVQLQSMVNKIIELLGSRHSISSLISN